MKLSYFIRFIVTYFQFSIFMSILLKQHFTSFWHNILRMHVNVIVFRQIQILNMCISVALHFRSHYVFRYIVAYLGIMSVSEDIPCAEKYRNTQN
jgi:hypothetical protein